MGFEADIKPLFREKDQQRMMFAFDLWDYYQVRANAEEILGRLESGSMPCDGAWPSERLEAFRTWIAQGMQP